MTERYNDSLRAFLRTGNLDSNTRRTNDQTEEWQPGLRARLMYFRQRNKGAGFAPNIYADEVLFMIGASNYEERPILKPNVQPRDLGYMCKRILEAEVDNNLSNTRDCASLQSNPQLDGELYRKLNADRHEIRLLSLSPAGWSEPIKCRLTIVPLDENPQYEALSYAWGDLSVTRGVRINEEHEFQVTISLESALRCLRKPTRPRIIWADAVCINQEDIDERSQQVSIMDQIYGKAQEVHVWLGDEEQTDDSTDNSRAAIRVLEWFASDVHFRQLPFYQGNDPSIRNPIDAKGPHLLRAFMRFINRPWWTRAWAIQETALPHTITLYVGYVKVSWDLVSGVAALMEKHRTTCCGSELDSLIWANHLPFFTKFSNSVNIIQDCRNKMQGVRYCRYLLKKIPNGVHRDPVLQNIYVKVGVQLREILSETDSDPLRTLLFFLTVCRSHESTDPRDKAFAVMGMAAAYSRQRLFRPDYSISAESVYQFIATALVETRPEGLRTILEKEDTNRTRFKTLPSWVPDWSVSNDYDEHRHLAEALFTASGKEIPQKSIDGRVLSVKGIEVDSIKAVGEVMSSMHDMKEVRTHKSWLRLWKSHNQYQHTSTPYTLASSPIVALWQTLFGGLQLFIPSESETRGTRGANDKAIELERHDLRLSARRCRPEDLYAFTRWAYSLTSFMNPIDSYSQGFFTDMDLEPESTQNSFPVEDAKQVPIPASGGIIVIKEEPWSKGPPDSFPSKEYDTMWEKFGHIPTTFSQGTSLVTAYQTIRCATMGKPLLITEKGYLGLCPKDSKPGDSVFIIAGLGVPLILRKSQAQESSESEEVIKWQLVGTSYVHGIMDGELASEEAWSEGVTVGIE
ncbi:hypothetical protein MMC10_004009 [Thelotrema lepadinum]|nr:hypothetical protein [Thelotrema lepadinum]